MSPGKKKSFWKLRFIFQVVCSLYQYEKIQNALSKLLNMTSRSAALVLPGLGEEICIKPSLEGIRNWLVVSEMGSWTPVICTSQSYRGKRTGRQLSRTSAGLSQNWAEHGGHLPLPSTLKKVTCFNMKCGFGIFMPQIQMLLKTICELL